MRFFHGERRAASISLAHGATGWSVIALGALLRESAALGALGHCGGSLAVFLDPVRPHCLSMHGRLQCQAARTQPLNSIVAASRRDFLTAGLLGLGRGISVAAALDG